MTVRIIKHKFIPLECGLIFREDFYYYNKVSYLTKTHLVNKWSPNIPESVSTKCYDFLLDIKYDWLKCRFDTQISVNIWSWKGKGHFKRKLEILIYFEKQVTKKKNVLCSPKIFNYCHSTGDWRKYTLTNCLKQFLYIFSFYIIVIQMMT